MASKPTTSDDNSANVDDPQPVGDIEDIGLAGGPNQIMSKPKVPTVTTNKRKRDASPPPMAATWLEALGPPPPKEEFKEWIAYHKRKWKWQREKRAAESKMLEKRTKFSSLSNDIVSGPPARGSLGSFLHKTQKSLIDSPWHILQFAETSEPGTLRCWVLVGSELHNIRVVVPRVFYVNQRIPRSASEDSSLYRKCVKVLPRSRPTMNLYQFVVSEKLFQEFSQELIADLSTPDIEGIYETQVKPTFRAILNLGNVCGVQRKEAQRLLFSGLKDLTSFGLDQLDSYPAMSNNYLSNMNTDLKFIYLYHHKSQNGTKSMFGLFLTPNKKAIVIVHDTVRTNQMPNLNNLYSSERTNKLARGKKPSALPPENIMFEVHFETDMHTVYRRISRALSSYKEERKGPTLISVQSRIDVTSLSSAMPVLNDFPVATIHIQDPELLYATLDWQRVGSKTMLGHYLSNQPTLQVILEQSRYYQVPLCNIQSDATLFASDVFYARFLQKNNFVLWVSETDKPDLGGREADDNRMLTEFEESTSMIVNKPGCYSSVCVELDIESLAVNTLLQSHHVHELEGTSSSISFDTMPQASLEEMVEGTTITLPSYDETALCSAAFKVLRSVVSAWLKDIAKYQNVFADFQIVHFYRWLRSPNALLYDPALRRTLHNLMKKLFMQLIAELKRLGSIIVYANFHKVIICTKKRTVEDAIGYVEFVVQSIRNKELFHGIDISYNKCWLYLMWLDPWNHGGIKGSLPDNIMCVGELEKQKDSQNSDEEDLRETEEEDDEPEVIMCWNIMEYLPEKASCQQQFNVIVASYILRVYQYLQENEPLGVTPKRRRQKLSQMGMSQPLGVGAHENTIEYVKQFINNELSQKMFLVTEKIHKKIPSIDVDLSTDHLLSRPSDSRSIVPALELVKSVCKVLELDTSITDEVIRLKRNLLRLIGVGEFSSVAQWKDPCLSYVLPEVICSACNHCRDIDLCKDPHRVITEDGNMCWQCPVCESFYQNENIEYLLIDALNRKIMAFTLQDLQCKRCLQIKMENMNRQCACAGEYQTLISENDLPTHLKTFNNIAEIFKMPLLKEMVEWISEKQ